MKDLLADLIAVLLIVIPMMLSAAGVAGAAYLVDKALRWLWYEWLIAAPLLYVCWLLVFLLTSALTCRQLGKKHPKPRYKAIRPGQPPRDGDFGLLTVLVCNRRAAMVTSLPLVSVLEQATWLRKLVLHAYSPSVHIGKLLTSWGYIYDPDLTEIGDNVVIGGRAAIAAHSMAMRKDGEMVYVSAPIRIGDRATIGGESRVALGCVIEDDVVVEPGSVVAPFTRIPAGEVWGGNPASFRRHRDDIDAGERAVLNQNGARPDNPVADRPVSPSIAQRNGSGTAPDEIRDLVLAALDLTTDGAPAELDSDTCPSWDSLGQIAIAAAIFDRYGVAVDENEVYRIRTLEDVAQVIREAGIQVSTDTHAQLALEPPASLAAEESTIQGLVPDSAAVSDDLEMMPLLDPQEATRMLAARFQSGPPAGQRLSIVIAATFTAQPLATSLKLWGRAFGFELDCTFVGSGETVQALLTESGPFVSNRDGINVVLARPEDFAADSDPSGMHRMEQVLSALEQYVSAHAGSGQLLVGTLPPLVSVFPAIDRKQAEALRYRWQTRLDDTPGITLFDFALVVERAGIEAARASGTEVLMRAPYSPRLYQELGIALVREMRAGRRPAAKVVAVDCDNTLWGGVVGEVGLEGIELGPDGAGRSYQLFQRYLKQLKARGFLLTLASKNEEHDVRSVFERHPEMILRWEDIVAWRVNWGAKSQNLQEMAEQLNLGIDSFVFVDDDPVARLEVKTRLPEVHVVPLPNDPAAYCETLDRLWLFDGVHATAVDAARTRLMQEESRRHQEHTSAASLEEFLAQLDLQIQISPPMEPEWSRVAQLTQRTNQFNLSLKRRTVEEVRALASEASVLVLRATDRFGDYGLVGVGIIRLVEQSKTAEIDTWLLSCRALGRGVEEAFLHGMASVAASQGAQTLEAQFVAGPRNEQVKSCLARSGFVEAVPTKWVLNLSALPALPRHVQFRMSDQLEPAFGRT